MIVRELAIFGVVGTLTVLVDFATYRLLVLGGVLDVATAKAAGFLAGTVFAYFANRFWTFGGRPHAAASALRFGLLYALTLGANVAVNALALRAAVGPWGGVHVAFVLATGVSATLNFIGIKWFVFRAAHGLREPA